VVDLLLQWPAAFSPASCILSFEAGQDQASVQEYEKYEANMLAIQGCLKTVAGKRVVESKVTAAVSKLEANNLNVPEALRQVPAEPT